MSRLAVNAHEIGRVLSGAQSFILRPALSSFYHVQPGDALWLAEPFHLHARWDGLAPTVARDRRARPIFAADYPEGPPADYGKRHPARALCRDWHRFHVVITAREQLSVTEVSAADRAVLGFENRIAFEDYWGVQTQLTGFVCGTAHNQLLRFGLKVERRPLPDRAQRPNLPHLTWAQKRALADSIAAGGGGVKGAPVHLSLPAIAGEVFTTERGDAPFLAALKRERPRMHADFVHAPARRRTALDRVAQPLPANGTCPTCGTRLAYGCAHHPIAEAAE